MKVFFESKGDFDGIRSWLKKVSAHDSSMVASQIASEGVRSLSANTPRETGETSSGWVSKTQVSGDVTEISWTNTAHPEAEVNVAKLIELGHGTGTGGYVPPRPYIKQAMKPVWKKVDDIVSKELSK